MNEHRQVSRFQEIGPELNGKPLLEKRAGRFIVPTSIAKQKNPKSLVLEKIAVALDISDFADAAIRFAQAAEIFQDTEEQKSAKANFNPAQPRNRLGEWSDGGSSPEIVDDDPKGEPSPAFCKIVKELCIAESIDTLPTGDFGFRFWNAVNACMDRHGCLGRA